MIHPARIPVLCGSIGLAASHLKLKTGLRAFDPALIYILFPVELRGYERGSAVVDLTNIPQPTTAAAWALGDMMEERGLVPIALRDLHQIIRAWHVTHPGYLAKPAR